MSTLNFLDAFTQSMKIETENKPEEKQVKKRVIHSPNVIFIKGTYKGYTGYVVETNPGTYQISLDENQQIGKGLTKKIQTIKDLKELMENNIEYNASVNTYNENDGVSLLQGNNYTVFVKEKASNEWKVANNSMWSWTNNWESIYEDWNWNSNGGYFDKKLTTDEKEYRKVIEEGLNKSMDVDVDETPDIDIDFKYIIDNVDYLPTQVSNIVIYDNGNGNRIGKIVKISESDIIVQEYSIDTQKYTDTYDYAVIQSENEKNRSKIIEMTELLENKQTELILINEKLTELNNRIISKFNEIKDNIDNDEEYMRLILTKQTKKNEMMTLTKTISELIKRIDILNVSIFVPVSLAEFLLEKVQDMIRRNKVVVGDPLRISFDNVNKLFSIVTEWGHKNIGKYGEIQITSVIYKRNKKVTNVSGRNIDGTPKIGERVKIKKGSDRNKFGVIMGKTKASLSIHIDSIGRTVNNHLVDYQDKPIYNDDVMHLDVYTKDGIYLQVSSVNENAYIVQSMDQLVNKTKGEIEEKDISRFGPGFRLTEDKVNKPVTTELEYVNTEPEETDQTQGTDETEESNEVDDYGDIEDTTDLTETITEEQELKGSYADVDRMFIMTQELTPEQKKIISIIEKIKKLIAFQVNEFDIYKDISEITKQIKESAGIWTDIDYKYITLCMVLYHLVKTGDIDYVESYISSVYPIFNVKDTGSIFLKNGIFGNLTVDRRALKELITSKNYRSIYMIIVRNGDSVLQNILGTSINIDIVNKSKKILVPVSKTKKTKSIEINLTSERAEYQITMYIDNDDDLLGVSLSKNLAIEKSKYENNDALKEFIKNLNNLLFRDSLIYIKSAKYQELVEYITNNIKLKNIKSTSFQLRENVVVKRGSLLKKIKKETGDNKWIKVSDYVFNTLTGNNTIPYYINELLVTNEYSWIMDDIRNYTTDKYILENLTKLPFILKDHTGENKSEMKKIFDLMYNKFVEQYITNKMIISYSDVISEYKEKISNTLDKKVSTKATTDAEKKQKRINILVYYYVLINIKRLPYLLREQTINQQLYVSSISNLESSSLLRKYLTAYLRNPEILKEINDYVKATTSRIWSSMYEKMLNQEREYIQNYFGKSEKLSDDEQRKRKLEIAKSVREEDDYMKKKARSYNESQFKNTKNKVSNSSMPENIPDHSIEKANEVSEVSEVNTMSTMSLIDNVRYNPNLKEIKGDINQRKDRLTVTETALIYAKPDVINLVLNASPYIKQETLMIAIQYQSNETDIIKRIVDMNPENVNNVNLFGWTPLMYAIMYANYQIVDYILSATSVQFLEKENNKQKNTKQILQEMLDKRTNNLVDSESVQNNDKLTDTQIADIITRIDEMISLMTT